MSIRLQFETWSRIPDWSCFKIEEKVWCIIGQNWSYLCFLLSNCILHTTRFGIVLRVCLGNCRFFATNLLMDQKYLPACTLWQNCISYPQSASSLASMLVPGFVKIIATTLILQVANPQSFAMSESRYEWLFPVHPYPGGKNFVYTT